MNSIIVEMAQVNALTDWIGHSEFMGRVPNTETRGYNTIDVSE